MVTYPAAADQQVRLNEEEALDLLRRTSPNSPFQQVYLAKVFDQEGSKAQIDKFEEDLHSLRLLVPAKTFEIGPTASMDLAQYNEAFRSV